MWSWLSVEGHKWIWKAELVAGRLHPARIWAWRILHTGLHQDQMHLVRHWPGHPDPDPGRFCTVWSMPSLEKWNQIRCRKSDQAYTVRSDSGCMLALTAITGHNRNAFESISMFTGGVAIVNTVIYVCTYIMNRLTFPSSPLLPQDSFPQRWV